MSDAAGVAASAGVPVRCARAPIGRYLGRGVLALVVALVLAWVGYKGSTDVGKFWTVSLNGITEASRLFIVASGFTLIFGLMRVVNMAHGSFFLLGGYIAFEVQKNWGNWGLGLLIACLGIGATGILTQQAFLRWNQGQELRQALITIAISIILADQMLGEFGGAGVEITWPPQLDKSSPLHFFHLRYPFTGFFTLFCAIAIGVLLWLWLKRTRSGMIIRAGVDDRAMVSALGINIQVIFALAFAIGSALAAFGGVLYGSYAGLAPGYDALFLLNSLIVVIIGGLGSIGGAAVGALLLGMVRNYSNVYLIFGSQDYTYYSIIATFALLVFVLAVRPLGLFGRPA